MMRDQQLSNYMRCADPVFAALRALVDTPATPAIAKYAQHAYASFYAGLAEIEPDEDSVKLVGYALAALLDEKMLSQDWEGQKAWQQQPLQLKYFNEHVAGEGFFNRFYELQKNYPKQSGVYLFYLYCLMFGFQGKYLGSPSNELEGLIAQAINEVAPESDEPPFVPLTNEAKIASHKRLYHLVGCCLLGGVAFVYLVFLGMSLL